MKQPTAPDLYPLLSEPIEEGQNYRLQKISEIEQTLINERNDRVTLYKKYNRGINIMDGIDTALVSAAIIFAGAGLVAPIMFPLEIVAAVCGSAGICIKFIRRRLHTKTKKHYEIKTIADTKLNSIKDLISRSLTDGIISENEFKLILDELEKYNKLKGNVRSKQIGLSTTERKTLIEEGKAQAMSELKKK